MKSMLATDGFVWGLFVCGLIGFQSDRAIGVVANDN